MAMIPIKKLTEFGYGPHSLTYSLAVAIEQPDVMYWSTKFTKQTAHLGSPLYPEPLWIVVVASAGREDARPRTFLLPSSRLLLSD